MIEPIRAAFLYDDDAHVERLRRVEAPAVPGARGLVGRQPTA